MSEIKISNFFVEVLHTYQEEILPLVYDHYFSGGVVQNSVPTERTLYAYNSSSYKLVGKCSSDVTGTFLLPVTTSGTCYVICLSNNSYNHLIAKQINPAINE